MNEELEAVKETAKAVQEAAKLGGKVVDASVQLSSFIKGPVCQVIGMLEDWLKFMRGKNLVKLASRVQEIMTAQGLNGPNKPIPLKLAVPLLEAATLEDDDYLRDRWATLLVNSATIESGINLTRTYIDILERMTALEVRLLEKIYSTPTPNVEEGYGRVITGGLPEHTEALQEEQDKTALSEPSTEVKLALANLERLGCVTFSLSWSGQHFFHFANKTILGQSFYTACTLRA